MKKFTLIYSILLSLMWWFLPKSQAKHDEEFKLIRVLQTTDIEGNKSFATQKEQLVKAQIVSDGKDKNSIIFIDNAVPENQAYSIIAKADKKYLITFDRDLQRYVIVDHFRQPIVIAVLALFCFLMIVLGGSKGTKAIVSLIIDVLAIIYIFIPAIEAGGDPLFYGVIVAIIAAASTMTLIMGFTSKALSATIGTGGGVLISGILAYLAIKWAPLSGLASTEAMILLGNLGYEGKLMLDFQSILAAGILIASLGAIMDVSVSIASAARELFEVNPYQSYKELLHHLMNVGKDIMGTMVDTLILAYVGSSIPLFLLLAHEHGLRLLNMEIIATELISALTGSIGLLCSIPITAVVSTLLLKKSKLLVVK